MRELLGIKEYSYEILKIDGRMIFFWSFLSSNGRLVVLGWVR